MDKQISKAPKFQLTDEEPILFEYHLNLRKFSMSQDSKTYATMNELGNIRIFRTNQSKLIKQFNAEWDEMQLFQVSNEGKYLAICRMNTIELWKIQQDPIAVKIEEAYDNEIKALVFYNDCTKMISSSEDSTIKIWRCDTQKCLQTLKGHGSSVNTLSITQNDTILASGSSDKSIKLWDLTSFTCKNDLKEHQGEVKQVQIAAEGNKMVSIDSNKQVIIWDLRSKKVKSLTINESNSKKEHQYSILEIAISPDGENFLFFVNNEDNNSKNILIGGFESLDRYQEGELVDDIVGEVEEDDNSEEISYFVKFSQDGESFFFEYNNQILKWNIDLDSDEVQIIHIFTDDINRVNYPQITQDGGVVLAVGWGDNDTIYSMNPVQKSWNAYFNGILCELIGGKKILKAYCQSEGEIIDIESKSRHGFSRYYTTEVTAHAMSSDGSKIAISNFDNIGLLDCETDELISEIFNKSSNCLKFSPDNRILISAEQNIEVYDVKTMKLVQTVAKRGQNFQFLSYSPNGRYILTQDGDKIMKVWDAKTFRCINSRKIEGKILNDFIFGYIAMYQGSGVIGLRKCHSQNIVSQIKISNIANNEEDEEGKFEFYDTRQNVVLFREDKEIKMATIGYDCKKQVKKIRL